MREIESDKESERERNREREEYVVYKSTCTLQNMSSCSPIRKKGMLQRWTDSVL
jgi:hypothetical protein